MMMRQQHAGILIHFFRHHGTQHSPGHHARLKIFCPFTMLTVKGVTRKAALAMIHHERIIEMIAFHGGGGGGGGEEN
jgi:hypothetical protein